MQYHIDTDCSVSHNIFIVIFKRQVGALAMGSPTSSVFFRNLSIISHLETFALWCWRRVEKFIWTDHVRNAEVLLRVKEQRNILHGISKRKANWIGHILRRNCFLQQVIEEKIK
jgi:hypothetical protein